jgi:hypothetical protein
MKRNCPKFYPLVIMLMICPSFLSAQKLTGFGFFLSSGFQSFNPDKADQYRVGKKGWTGVGLNANAVFNRRYIANAGFSFGNYVSDHDTQYAEEFASEYGYGYHKTAIDNREFQYYIEGGLIQKLITFGDGRKGQLLYGGVVAGISSGIGLTRRIQMDKVIVANSQFVGNMTAGPYIQPNLYICSGEALKLQLSYRYYLDQSGIRNVFTFGIGALITAME